MKKILDIFKFILIHPLARKHKFKSFYKVLSWQLSQLLFPRLVKCSFVGNTKLLVKKGMTGATGNIYAGLHEFYEMTFLLHFLRAEDTFVDIGANIGSYTILASGVIGSETVCIEPVFETFVSLKKNILLNNLDSRVRALNIAIGSMDGSLYLTNNLDTTNHVIWEVDQINNPLIDNNNLIKVSVKPLDQILENENCPRLIKIDVEGFEQEVINGALNTLENSNLKAIIIELNGSGKNYGYNEENIHTTFLKNNFLPYKYYPFERRLEKLDTHGTNNTIYIRDLEFVENRLVNANKIKIFSEKL